MADRPMVNVYEADDEGEHLVYREMNDDEFAAWEALCAEAAAEAANQPPTLEEKLAEALEQLPQDKPVTGAQLGKLISTLRGQ